MVAIEAATISPLATFILILASAVQGASRVACGSFSTP
jgi:hypothetical protein